MAGGQKSEACSLLGVWAKQSLCQVWITLPCVWISNRPLAFLQNKHGATINQIKQNAFR